MFRLHSSQDANIQPVMNSFGTLFHNKFFPRHLNNNTGKLLRL